MKEDEKRPPRIGSRQEKKKGIRESPQRIKKKKEKREKGKAREISNLWARIKVKPGASGMFRGEEKGFEKKRSEPQTKLEKELFLGCSPMKLGGT